MNSLLVWWLLSGGGIDRLPFAVPGTDPWREKLLERLAAIDVFTGGPAPGLEGPHPEPWRQQLITSLAVLSLVNGSVFQGPTPVPWREIRRLAIQQLRTAVEEIPEDN